MNIRLFQIKKLPVFLEPPTVPGAVKAPDMKQGDILDVLGDCPTFEKDVRTWCERLGKVFLSVKDDGANQKSIQIQF